MKVIKYYRYRTARIKGDRVYFPRDLMRDFESELARLADVKIDNHTIYMVNLGGSIHDTTKYFMFHDFNMIMGDEVTEGTW